MQNKQAVASNNRLGGDKRRLWKAAIKWPLYSVAVMPLILATGWSIGEGLSIRIKQCIGFVVASMLLLLWENLTNDLFDAETGIDESNKPHSVVALVGERGPITKCSYFVLSAGLAIILILASKSHFYVFFLVLSSCFLGYLYQGPPFRLGYKGLGEPLCWLAFGPLATSAALLTVTPKEYFHNGIPWLIAITLSAGPALATTLILFCSHFHQVSEDASYGKKSPIVRLGTQRAAELIPWFISLVFILEGIPIMLGFSHWLTVLSLASLPSGISLIRLLKRHHNHPDKISGSKFLALRFQFLNGLGLSIGLALANFL